MNKTKLDEVKTEEREVLLALFYARGHFDDPPSKECKDFRNLIIDESKKRKVKPYELLMYFAEHKKELLELLEKKSIKKSKIPSGQRIAKNPKEFGERGFEPG